MGSKEKVEKVKEGFIQYGEGSFRRRQKEAKKNCPPGYHIATSGIMKGGCVKND